MRIDRLELAAFGHFTDHALDFGAPPAPGEPDLHLVYGPNEAGKSTTLAAVAELLHGMPHRSAWAFRHDNATLEIGARLSGGGGGGGGAPLEVRRFKNRLVDGHGNALERGAIDVHGLSIEEYRARFSLDEKTLERGSDEILAQQGEIGAALFSAAAGLADLGERLERAMRPADAFYLPRKRTGIDLIELKAELERVEAELRERDTDTAAWTEMRSTTDAARAGHVEQEALVARLETERAALARREAAASGAVQRRDLLAKLAALEGAVEMAPAEIERVETDLAARAAGRGELDAQDAQLGRDAAALEALATDPDALARADEIDALARERVLIAERRGTEAADRQALDEARRRRDALARELGSPTEAGAADAAVPEATLVRLEGLARERARLVATHESATGELDAVVARARSAGLDASGTSDAADGPGDDADDGAADARDGPPTPGSTAAGDVLPDVTLLSAQVDRLVEAAPQAGLAALVRRRDEAARAARAALEALAPWHGDADALAVSIAPEPVAIAGLGTRAAALAARARDLDEAVRAHRDADAVNADARDALAIGELVDDATLARLRATRDALLSAHRDSIGSGADADADALTRELDAIGSALDAADAAADARVSHGDALARLRTLDVERASLARRAGRLDVERVELVEARASLAADVARVGDDLGLPGAPLETLAGWAPRRTAALGHAATLRTAEGDLDASRDEVRVEAARLAELLSPALPDTASGISLVGASLDELLPLARRTVDATVRMRETREREARERAALVDELGERRRSLSAARDALDAWTREWRDALTGTGLPETDPATDVARLPRLRELGAAMREAIGLEEKVRALDAVLGRFAGRAATLGVRLAPDDAASGSDAAAPPSPDDALALVAGLESRLAEARRVDALAVALRERVGAATRARDAAADALAPTLARLNAARERCAAADVEALGEAIRRASRRRELTERLEDVEASLRDALGEADLDVALEGHAPAERDELAAERAALESRLAIERRELDERLVALRTGERALEHLDDGAAVAELQAGRATILHEIETRGLETLRLRLGRLALEAGLNRFRERHRSGMMEHARRAFVALTDDQFSDLRARPDDRGRERLVGVRSDGGTLDTDRMSTGTRFQLFLALRVAAWHEYADERAPLPFVADDILESFDERRTAAAFGLMRDMARRGQVIYLTHHRHLADIARAAHAGVRVHELPARGSAMA